MNTHDMLMQAVPGKEYRISIVEFINALDGSVDFPLDNYWVAECFRHKTKDWTFPGILASILEQGLTLPLNAVRWDEVVGMGNGHHRLVAALLCGIETITIVVSDGDCDFDSTSYEDDAMTYCGQPVRYADPLGIADMFHMDTERCVCYTL